MRSIIKILFFIIIAAFLCGLVFFYIKAGDLLLEYLADSLHFKISYKNRCSFADAFINKTVHLDSPILMSKDFPLKIECESADIQLDYSRLIKEGGIGLHCWLKKPVICPSVLQLKNDAGIVDMFPAAVFSAVSMPANMAYEDLFCDLYMYGETVEFPFFLAKSQQIIMRAMGSANEEGQLKIDLKIFFSPEIVAQIGEHADVILEEAQGGWMTFEFKMETGEDGQAFKVESDMFSLTINEIVKE
ncbi:MAG: hypothetical protein HQ579_04195 [Candidatus Omnitrophica bacterium]|nr:hypothetical protein [Candidatus Omnitrophota bacterium]